MEEKKEISGLLDMISRPGFYTENNLITTTNSAAAALMLLPGMDIREYICAGAEEYEAMEGGCLCLTLSLGERLHSASVTRRPEGDLFLLEQPEDLSEFRAMALVSRELRIPLNNALWRMERLSSVLPEEAADSADSMNRSLYQILRTLANMSDVVYLEPLFHPELQNIPLLISEIFEKAAALAEHRSITLTYQPLQESIIGLVDAPQLERAIHNILSNALKFTPEGGHIAASLVRSGQMLRLTIADSGSGIAREVLESLFYRHLRQPAIEDCRYGIGLGLVLVRKIAANHGGGVLIDQAPGGGTRVTLTFAIRQKDDLLLRSPLLRPDYTGERDHALVELADTLPSSLYRNCY